MAEPRQAQKGEEKVVREGDTHEFKKITFKVMEVIPHFDPAYRPRLMVGYRLIDGDYESQTAHLWMGKNEDIRPHVERVVEYYLGTVRKILGVKG